MKTVPTYKDDYEVFIKQHFQSKLLNNVGVLSLTNNKLASEISVDIYLKSTLFILVQEGIMELLINNQMYEAKNGEVLLLSFGHKFNIYGISTDFKCLSLYIGSEYVQEMYSTDMLYKRAKYGIKMYKEPLLSPLIEEFQLLEQRVLFAAECLGNLSHRYLEEMVLNALRIFFLDLSDIIETKYETQQEATPSREEMYFQEFLNLLVHHYKTQHQVDFYADKIAISTRYLTQIVKRLSGQTVSEYIFQLVYSEARQLLRQPNLSIQEIALQLNFSDQSAFGKFFKRNSGSSPLEFRKTLK